MLKNRHSSRSLIAFLVAWSFLVLTITGVALYVVPQGRVAYWIHWSLLGMEKEQWGWVHMMFGGVFIVTGILHLYFNWKPFKSYVATRVSGHLTVKREILVASALTAAIFAVSVLNVPPASWVIDLNSRVKSAWVSSPELEPPFGHAEEVSLAGMARRMQLDLDRALQALQERGIAFADAGDSLEAIARANAITPMQVYAVIREYRQATAAAPADAPATAADIETRFAGTGLGRKPLAELCALAGIDTTACIARLAQAGIAGAADENARDVAERHQRNPIDLLKLLMLPSGG